MKKLDTVNWGIIGVGDVTELKSGPAFYKSEHSKLVAVMRRDGKKAADYAARHGVPKWYDNGSHLINDPEVDAVYIATPPDSHAGYAIKAMRIGKPVYVEKPMARSFAECQEMIRVSEQTGLPLWVAYYRRTLPAFLKAKELIGSGEIGKPLMVRISLYAQARERNQSLQEMNWRVFPETAGAGHFFDLASHQFDYLDYLFGAVREVQGRAMNYGGLYPAEDTVSGSWLHESGVVGAGSWSFIVEKGSEQDEILILGDKGEITLSCFAASDTLTIKTSDGEKQLKFTNPEHISQNLVKQVIDELRGVGSCVSTGESAARTNRVLGEMVSNYYPESGL